MSDYIKEVAEDQITRMHDEVRVTWKQNENGLALIGSVIVDGKDVIGNAAIRNNISYKEMPTEVSDNFCIVGVENKPLKCYYGKVEQIAIIK